MCQCLRQRSDEAFFFGQHGTQYSCICTSVVGYFRGLEKALASVNRWTSRCFIFESCLSGSCTARTDRKVTDIDIKTLTDGMITVFH